jgi:hypothetical protein
MCLILVSCVIFFKEFGSLVTKRNIGNFYKKMFSCQRKKWMTVWKLISATGFTLWMSMKHAYKFKIFFLCNLHNNTSFHINLDFSLFHAKISIYMNYKYFHIIYTEFIYLCMFSKESTFIKWRQPSHLDWIWICTSKQNCWELLFFTFHMVGLLTGYQ